MKIIIRKMIRTAVRNCLPHNWCILVQMKTDQYGDYTMNSFQIGKLDSGNGTSAVVIVVNIYDPSQIEEESSEEGSIEKGSSEEKSSEECIFKCC